MRQSWLPFAPNLRRTRIQRQSFSGRKTQIPMDATRPSERSYQTTRFLPRNNIPHVTQAQAAKLSGSKMPCQRKSTRSNILRLATLAQDDSLGQHPFKRHRPPTQTMLPSIQRHVPGYEVVRDTRLTSQVVYDICYTMSYTTV